MSVVETTRALVGIFLVASLGAGCSREVQVRVDAGPVRFIDRDSRSIVTPVVILPRYGSHLGVSTGAGHGPGAMASSGFIANPFRYSSGAPFRPTVERSRGVEVGSWMFVGRGVELQGVTVLASGYEPFWFWRLWERGPAEDSQSLVPAGHSNGDRLFEILSGTNLDGADLTEGERRGFNLSPDARVDLRLSRDELNMIKTVLVPGSGR